VEHIPQLPPQPSEPHCLPLHILVQHVPWLQTCVPAAQPQSVAQLAQFSCGAWQPFTPHRTSTMHLPSELQILPLGHVPQVLPHLSSPHSFPLHCGSQHWPAVVHFCEGAHAQSAAQLLQSSPVWHPFLPQMRSGLQLPATHDEPEAQGAVPQVPPHPSLPQVLPAQLGVQHFAL
jgi:hypothetical protein